MKSSFTAKNVTECLARAMEHADEMKHVIVVYEAHDEDEKAGGWFSTKGMTVPTMNYLFDMAKQWILGRDEL